MGFLFNNAALFAVVSNLVFENEHLKFEVWGLFVRETQKTEENNVVFNCTSKFATLKW